MKDMSQTSQTSEAVEILEDYQNDLTKKWDDLHTTNTIRSVNYTSEQEKKHISPEKRSPGEKSLRTYEEKNENKGLFVESSARLSNLNENVPSDTEFK